MKQSRFFRILAVLISAFLPWLANAQTRPKLPNPLGLEGANLIDVILRGLQVILGVIDIFALFMFILGGFELLTSGGNPDRIKRGKETLVWATAGIVVITLSYAILKFVFESLTKVSG